MRKIEFINTVSVPVFFGSIIVILFVTSISAYYLGRSFKDRPRPVSPDLITNNIIGLLALILSFSFSMALNRFEYRRLLTVQEANAISTAYLRSELIGINARKLFNEYLDRRVLYQDTYQLQKDLWNQLKSFKRGVFKIKIGQGC